MSLISYIGILYRALADIVLFDLIPNKGQITAIAILVVVQLAHLIYKQRAQVKAEREAKQESSLENNYNLSKAVDHKTVDDDGFKLQK